MNLQSLKTKANIMKSNLIVLYLAFKHKRTPWYAKLLTAIVLAYALSPIDLIPDFIPVLGYWDDLVLIPAGIALAMKLIPQDIIWECREVQHKQRAIKINKIYGTVLILAIWLLVIFLIIKSLS